MYVCLPSSNFIPFYSNRSHPIMRAKYMLPDSKIRAPGFKKYVLPDIREHVPYQVDILLLHLSGKMPDIPVVLFDGAVR